MGIEAELKQISLTTLELLKQDYYLWGSFFSARWLPDFASWRELQWSEESTQTAKQQVREKIVRLPLSQTLKRSLKQVFKPHEVVDLNWEYLEKLFISEWEVPHLDVHKYFQGINILIAGYTVGYYSKDWILPELEIYTRVPNRDFLPFLVVPTSEWDGLPLVNAIGGGAELEYQTGYGFVKCLLPSEVDLVLDGLIQLGEEGFQGRYKRESIKKTPCRWIEWSNEDLLQDLTSYYCFLYIHLLAINLDGETYQS
jgi:hypothetical protein